MRKRTVPDRPVLLIAKRMFQSGNVLEIHIHDASCVLRQPSPIDFLWLRPKSPEDMEEMNGPWKWDPSFSEEDKFYMFHAVKDRRRPRRHWIGRDNVLPRLKAAEGGPAEPAAPPALLRPVEPLGEDEQSAPPPSTLPHSGDRCELGL